MALLRCQITAPYFTNIPRDVSTNTIYFAGDNAIDRVALAQNAFLKTAAFYQSIQGFYSKVLVGPFRFAAYDMADPEPRTPIFNADIAMAIGGPNGNVAEEVAVVLSFQATPVAGANQARRRGRIYLGPLSFNAFNTVTGPQVVTVSDTFATTIASAAAAMAIEQGAARWVVYSAAAADFVNVERGWVDRSPDTQRRRGHLSGGRVLWVQATP